MAAVDEAGRISARSPLRSTQRFLEKRQQVLSANAAAYARVGLDNIQREFPSGIYHTMTAPGDFPQRPKDRTPVFYGSYDWHSCVEMHWMLVRLLRIAGDRVPADEIRSVLDSHYSADALAHEARFITGYGGQRPYGWGWALQLTHEISTWDDPDAQRWARNFEPLAEQLTANFLGWLPKATYPQRTGLHPNSAFGLSRALPYARIRSERGESALLDAITDAAMRWFAKDTDYPGAYEPSGSDFLSPALTEAELMAQLLPEGEFPGWLDSYLPLIARQEPRSLFEPVFVSDSSDGQIAHLHGLNASRAWGWLRLAESLPHKDSRVESMLAAAERHADAALPHVTGDDYMVEHWLACYAVLLLS